MYPVSSFIDGPEALYRFTEAGWRRRAELAEGGLTVDSTVALPHSSLAGSSSLDR
jgi:hypothetical protein